MPISIFLYCTHTHTFMVPDFLFYSLGYNLLPSSFIVMLQLSLIWHWQLLQAGFCVFLNSLSLSVSSFLLFGSITCIQVVILLVLQPSNIIHNVLYVFKKFKFQKSKAPQKTCSFHTCKNWGEFHTLLPCLLDMRHVLRSLTGALGEPVPGAWVDAGSRDASAQCCPQGAPSLDGEVNLCCAFHFISLSHVLFHCNLWLKLLLKSKWWVHTLNCCWRKQEPWGFLIILGLLSVCEDAISALNRNDIASLSLLQLCGSRAWASLATVFTFSHWLLLQPLTTCGSFEGSHSSLGPPDLVQSLVHSRCSVSDNFFSLSSPAHTHADTHTHSLTL